ncbi:putative T7SS-secreted protein [Streptomyces sp. NPDC002328]|uniref:putative T7SS-secreted protein n=1 Tax=Streptomyces sp. NPDC002328 TaxID=3364642 RepID=UPI0036ACF183
MTRPRADEWAVIGESADPIPGDPEEVARLGRSLRKTAEAIRKQADEIKALSSVEAWKSKAAEEFRGQAEEAEGKLRKAYKRYDAAADALGEKVIEGGSYSEYASELHRAQKMADKALRDAQNADGEDKASSGAIDKLPKDTADDAPDRKKLEKRQEAAASAMERAKKDLEAAKDVRDAAAKRARDAIRYAIDNDGLKDGTWDKFKDWVHDNSGWIKAVLEVSGWVATICGTLSLLVGWIPIVGQALAALLGSIALAATLVSLVGHVLLALSGDGSWFDVALDVVGLATFGIGRGALAGAKAASQGAQSLGRSAAAKALREGIKAKPGTPAYNRAINRAWREANELSGGALRGKAGAKAIAEAPKSWFPGASRLGDAFNPKLIGKEWLDGLKGIKELRPSNVRQLGQGDNWTGVRPRVGDSGIADLESSLGRMAESVRSLDEVKAATDVFQAQTRLWQGSTMIASTTDALDKGLITGSIGDLVGVDGLDEGVWDATGLKDATTTSDG